MNVRWVEVRRWFRQARMDNELCEFDIPKCENPFTELQFHSFSKSRFLNIDPKA